MVKVFKKFTFDSSHQLVGHKGKCANLHGHTYQLELGFTGDIILDEGSDEGMVIDFSDVKDYAKELVHNLDHAVFLQGNEPIIESQITTKRVHFGFRTTCEMMAMFIFYYLKFIKGARNLEIVRLWETPTGYAEVTTYDEPFIFLHHFNRKFDEVTFKDGE